MPLQCLCALLSSVYCLEVLALERLRLSLCAVGVVDVNPDSHKIKFTDDTEPHARTYLYSYPKSLSFFSEVYSYVFQIRFSSSLHKLIVNCLFHPDKCQLFMNRCALPRFDHSIQIAI